MERQGEAIDEEQGLIGRGVGSPDRRTWPTVDGPHGLLPEDECVAYARSYFNWGFALLPFLWAVNCCYFWPVLRNSHPSPLVRHYNSGGCLAVVNNNGGCQMEVVDGGEQPFDVMRSAIGFVIFTVLLASWSLAFIIGGERLFGPIWNDLVMYNLADRLGLTGWT